MGFWLFGRERIAWKYGNRRTVGRLALTLGLAGFTSYAVLGSIVFMMIADPNVYPAGDMLALDNGAHFMRLFGYFLGTFIFGLAVAVFIHRSGIKYRQLYDLTVLGLWIALITLFIPFVRGCAALLPPVGTALLLMLLGRSEHSNLGKARRRFLLRLFLAQFSASLLLAGLFEYALTNLRAASSVVFYSGGVVLGGTVLLEGYWIHAALQRPPGAPEAGGGAWPYPAPAEVTIRLEPETKSPVHARPHRTGWRVLSGLAIFAVVVAALTAPPFDVLFSGPRPSIAESHIGERDPSGRFPIEVLVQNKGAGEALDLELLVSNHTSNISLAMIDRLEGFMNWQVKKDFSFPPGFRTNHEMVILVVEGREVARRALEEGPCMDLIVLAPLLALGAALGQARHRRMFWA